jgi:hypothetical protein
MPGQAVHPLRQTRDERAIKKRIAVCTKIFTGTAIALILDKRSNGGSIFLTPVHLGHFGVGQWRPLRPNLVMRRHFFWIFRQFMGRRSVKTYKMLFNAD